MDTSLGKILGNISTIPFSCGCGVIKDKKGNVNAVVCSYHARRPEIQPILKKLVPDLLKCVANNPRDWSEDSFF